MNQYEQAIMEARIESEGNRVRALHNEMEGRRWFGKTYMPYCSKSFIHMVKLCLQGVQHD